MYNTTKGGYQPGQMLNQKQKVEETSVSQAIAKLLVIGIPNELEPVLAFITHQGGWNC